MAGFDSFRRGVSYRPEFNHIDLYNFLEINAETLPTGRTYKTPVGNLMSVTTMLSRTASPEKAAGLQAWRDRVGHEAAAKETARCANRGTALHDLAEQYLRNNEILNPRDENSEWFNRIKHEFSTQDAAPETARLAEAMFQSLKRKLNNVTDIVGLEVAVYSKLLNLAGRVDGIGTYKGKKCIIDFKTSNKPKKESYILDYCIQTTAYSCMLEDLTGLCYPNLAILIAVEEGLSTQEFIFHRNDYMGLLHEKIQDSRK